MSLTKEEVEHIGRLARLGLTEEEVAKFQGQLCAKRIECFHANVIPTLAPNVLSWGKGFRSVEQVNIGESGGTFGTFFWNFLSENSLGTFFWKLAGGKSRDVM